MNYLIFNADDFGYSRGVNFGIIDSYEKGILRSTTLMANMPGFNQAVEYALKNPGLGVGAHLTLTCGKPLLKNLDTITDTHGNFLNLDFYESGFKIDNNQLYDEWNAQIIKIQNAGINITHLDSHHHTNSIGSNQEVFSELARKYNLPVRNNYNVPNELKTTDFFYTKFDGFGFEKKIWKDMAINELLEISKHNKIVEVMVHPAYVDLELIEGSSYTDARTYTTKELMNKDYNKIFEENNIKLTNFSHYLK